MRSGAGSFIVGAIAAFLCICPTMVFGFAQEASADPTFTVVPFQNVSGGFQSISCPEAETCVAIGGQLVETLSGGVWTQSTISAPGVNPMPYDIWCASTTSCVAVGEYGTTGGSQAFVEYLDGSTWTTTTAGLNPPGAVSSTLTSVSCPVLISACFAAGWYVDGGGVWHSLFEALNNGTWTPSTAASPSGATSLQIWSIQCVTMTSCFGVGGWSPDSKTTDPLLVTFDGSTWSESTLGEQGDYLRSISCPTPSTCMAVGYMGNGQGVAETYSYGTWTRGLMPIPAGTSMNGIVGVSCPSSIATCIAVGGYRQPANNGTPDSLVETSSNQTWTAYTGLDPTPSYYGVPTAVACPSSSSCVGVGGLTGINSAEPMAIVETGSINPPPTTITVTVSGTQIYGGSPSFTETNDAPSGVTISGSIDCTSASGGPLVSMLQVGSTTLDGGSCSGLSASNNEPIDYVGATNGFTTNPAGTTTTLAVPVSVVYGDEGATPLGIGVSAPDSAVTPWGNVVVTSGSKTVCTVTLSSGSGWCAPGATSLPAGGPYALVATYVPTNSPNAEDFTQSETTGNLWVQKAPTKLVAAPMKTTDLVRRTFSATLTNDAAGTPIAGATIPFTYNGKKLCSALTNASGVASCTITDLLPAHPAYAATYAGDANYMGTSATASQ